MPTWAGVAYVCFITDVYSRMIVGWRWPFWASCSRIGPDLRVAGEEAEVRILRNRARHHVFSVALREFLLGPARPAHPFERVLGEGAWRPRWAVSGLVTVEAHAPGLMFEAANA